jgi:hypothetical protein
MFQLTQIEFEVLRSQIATANATTYWNYKKRYYPFVFTENGVAMLSSVLASQQAIQVNIAIMRIFTRLRSFLMLEKELSNRMNALEKDVSGMFKIVFERLDSLDEKIPVLDSGRKKIGFDQK